MKERVKQLRKIGLILDVSGTAKPIANTKLYQGGFGFVTLQVHVPITQNRTADTKPLCTVHRTTTDKAGNRKQFNLEKYNLGYVEDVEVDGAEYMLFECPLPKAFTETEGELELVFNYSELKGETVVSRLTTNTYTVTVGNGGVGEGELMTDLKSQEAARINANTMAIEQMEDVIDSLVSPPDCTYMNQFGEPRVEITPEGNLKFINMKGDKGAIGDNAIVYTKPLEIIPEQSDAFFLDNPIAFQPRKPKGSEVAMFLSAVDNRRFMIYGLCANITDGKYGFIITSFMEILGEKGEQGVQGAQGIQGERGEQGDTGAKGEIGVQGIQGLRGEHGEKGDTGAKGETGVEGIQGIQGERGEKGDTGAKGDTGTQGIQGIQGFRGPRGEKGDKGDSGSKGDQGDIGPQGVQGAKGEQGEPGPQGISGSQGLQGVRGERGIQGLQGAQGVQGEQGIKGDKGEDGATFKILGTKTSVSDLPLTAQAGDAYFVGASAPREIYAYDARVSMWVNQGHLQGPKGDQGIQGIRGTQGIKGESGDQGIQGENGERGDSGAQGIQGEKGVQGLQGLQGVQGAKGERGETGAKGDAGEQGIQGLQGAQGVKGERGETGAKGDTGVQGVPGARGATGESGAPGIKGDKGDTGAQGIQGVQGLKGDKGETGAQGIPGTAVAKGDKGDKGDTGSLGDMSGVIELAFSTDNTGSLVIPKLLYQDTVSIDLSTTEHSFVLKNHKEEGWFNPQDVILFKLYKFLSILDFGIEKTGSGVRSFFTDTGIVAGFAISSGIEEGCFLRGEVDKEIGNLLGQEKNRINIKYYSFGSENAPENAGLYVKITLEKPAPDYFFEFSGTVAVLDPMYVDMNSLQSRMSRSAKGSFSQESLLTLRKLLHKDK